MNRGVEGNETGKGASFEDILQEQSLAFASGGVSIPLQRIGHS